MLGSEILSVESEGLIINLTHDALTIRLKPDVIEKLREMTKGDPVLESALMVLLEWAHYPTIPVSDIRDCSVEVLPSRPGSPEHLKVTIKCDFHGGSITHELPLAPDAAQTLVTEIKRLTNAKF